MTRRSEPDDRAGELGRLYDRFAGALYRYAVMVLADPDGAADAVQQVFVAIAGSTVRLEHDERYLRRAIRNECFSRLRVRQRDVLRSAKASAERASALLESTCDAGDPADRLAIEDAIRRLPPDQREVLHLKIFEGMTFREIAEVTGEPMNTVASRFRYAMEKLRAYFGAPD